MRKLRAALQVHPFTFSRLPELRGVCGVYALHLGPQFYIGSTVNMAKRWAKHRSCLRRGVCESPELQRAFNALSSESQARFEVLQLARLEQDARTFEFELHKELARSSALLNVKAGDGAYFCPETKARRAESIRERFKDPEFRRRQAEGVRRHQRKAVQINFPCGSGESFESCKDAADYLGVNAAALGRLLGGARPWPKTGVLAGLSGAYLPAPPRPGAEGGEEIPPCDPAEEAATSGPDRGEAS